MSSFSPLSLTDKQFWTKVNVITRKGVIGYFKDGGLYHVAMKDTVQMVPFVRTREELFSTTAARISTNQRFLITINAQYYGLTLAGKSDALIGNDPVHPSHTLPEGRVVKHGVLAAGRAAPQMFFVAYYKNKTPRYQFGFGSAPLDATGAIGGGGPLIINGLPYGALNKYRAGASGGKPIGEPSARNKPFLTQRSNLTFKDMSALPPSTGKTVIAHSSKHKTLLVMILPHGAPGLGLGALRDKLIGVGVDNAIFLDGSDSSMLMLGGKPVVRQGENKDETNTVGIGFSALGA